MATTDNSEKTQRTTGGQAGVRGYLAQTLIALLDVLLGGLHLKSVTLEPNHTSEKFDILLELSTKRRAIQVKSSANQFTEGDVRRWAGEMEESGSAEEYHLCLVGLHSTAVAGLGQVGKVTIDRKNLDLSAFREQAAHRLDRFLRAEGLDRGTAEQREMLADALTTQLAAYSTKGQRLSRADLIKLLKTWVAEAPRKEPQVAPTRLSVTGSKFVGRETELQMLDAAWDSTGDGKINIISLIGQGGEGKTAIVLGWYSRHARHGWPGARRVFDWSFYSQGTSAQSAASADDFFAKAFAWFGHTDEVPRDPWTKGEKLAELIVADRTLLVLDGLEPLQQPPGDYGGEFKDPAMKALLRALALRNPGLCVLTSRTEVTDLKDFERAGGPCLRHPLHALDAEAARQLLRDLGVRGPDRELDEAVAWFKGHAYDLNLLGNYLAHCTSDHEIRRWKEILLLKEDEHVHGQRDAGGQREGHGRRMLRAYEQWLRPDAAAMAILRLLGLFDRPARSDLLDELRAAPVITGLTEALVDLPEDDWLRALDQLDRLGLIAREQVSVASQAANSSADEGPFADEIPDEVLKMLLQRDDFPAEMKKLPKAQLKQLMVKALGADLNKSKKAVRTARPVSYAVDTHPLLREHFAAELRSGDAEARRAAHRRLYEHLTTTTEEFPDTLEGLQPLYQAVAHGCQAGMQQKACDEVYWQRILRGERAYSTNKLGAFGADLGAVACFFEQPWKRVSQTLTEADQAWLLNQAAFRLRALGRLTEALEPMRAALEMDVERKAWKGAAISYSNLSELQLTLGEVAGAVGDAEQSVAYADRSGDAFWKMGTRTTLADALHQAGRRAEAEVRFREAEEMQAQRQPEYPLLYSQQGFIYCDLLLAAPERAAWELQLNPKFETGNPKSVESCCAVEQRAAKMFEWRLPSDPLLDIGLDHLTLGCAALYRAILEKSEAESARPAKEIRNPKREIEEAVGGLRRAGAQEFIVRGLLTRAWVRFLEGDVVGARVDLDEAWEIAERGPMKLFLADIHLHRARLFRDKEELETARKLIEQCGYGRRKEELEDAEAAAKGW
ncbi:MAG: ATP-binding protein [Verrucomicrobiia bacterium]|jgi:tetratricopeptide (TPR) repeat protein